MIIDADSKAKKPDSNPLNVFVTASKEESDDEQEKINA